jgi:hypothetical protein
MGSILLQMNVELDPEKKDKEKKRAIINRPQRDFI